MGIRRGSTRSLPPESAPIATVSHDDSAGRIAALAGLSGLGNKRETIGSVKDEETELSACSNGSLGWNRTNDQRINSPTLYR
jgi:hypothetical protein